MRTVIRCPSSYVFKRTVSVVLITVTLSITFSTAINLIAGVESDWITLILRVALPLIIPIPLCLIWFSKLEKLDKSYHALLKQTTLLAQRANTDALTGLLNRRSFVEQFELAMSNKVSGTFLIVDIDYLKQINDDLGHLAGDAAILATANALTKVLSEGSLIARIGGDEFCVFFDHSMRLAENMMQLVVGQAQKDFQAETEQPDTTLTMSYGLVTCIPNMSFTEALQFSDHELYRHKNKRQISAA